MSELTDEERFRRDIFLENCETAFEPMPVLSYGKGKLWKDSSTKEWFAKIEEEIIEAHEAAIEERRFSAIYKDALAEELTDIKTTCESYLNALGYDARARAELQRRVNAKNAARGYFETGEAEP